MKIILAAVAVLVPAMWFQFHAGGPGNPHQWYSQEIRRQFYSGVHSEPEQIKTLPSGTGNMTAKSLTESADYSVFDMTMMFASSLPRRSVPVSVNFFRVGMPDNSEICLDLCLKHGEIRQKDCAK